MKRNFTFGAIAVFFTVFALASVSMADDAEINIPITADQAFDAVVKQVDPTTGAPTSVALVDLRTTAEYYWVGGCGKINSITTTNDREYIPLDGKVKLMWGRYLSFKTTASSHFRRHRRRGIRTVNLLLRKVKAIDTEDISIHVPFQTWDDAGIAQQLNEDFAAQIESLQGTYNVLILMSRSGIRSNTREFDTSLFDAIYEIDQPDGTDGRGGFQGSSYGNAYIGYRGFPGRNTRIQDTGSVSWSDASLPVHTGSDPFIPNPIVSDPADDSDPVDDSEPADDSDPADDSETPTDTEYEPPVWY